MSLLAAEPTDRCAIPPEPAIPLSVEQYHRMVTAGILMDGDPIELLEGWLVPKMTKHPPHELAAGCTNDALSELVGPTWHVKSQGPISTADSEPEPDISVIRGQRRDYADRHPAPAEVGLVVEVADSSLERDRGWKKRIYAAAGIPTYWIVNLIDNCVEVFTQPRGTTENSDYTVTEVFEPGDDVSLVLEGQELGRIAVDVLLP